MVYAVVEDVAAYLGRTLTSDQQAQAQLALEAATAYVDGKTGRSWSPVSPSTEKHTLVGPFLYLENRPILSVTSLSVRPPDVASAAETLLAGSQYEILDADKGLLLIGAYGDFLTAPSDGWADYIATVTYTHSASPPANIKLATIILAAHYLSRALNSSSQLFSSMSDPLGLRVVFRDRNLPEEVKDLLNIRNRVSVV